MIVNNKENKITRCSVFICYEPSFKSTQCFRTLNTEHSAICVLTDLANSILNCAP